MAKMAVEIRDPWRSGLPVEAHQAAFAPFLRRDRDEDLAAGDDRAAAAGAVQRRPPPDVLPGSPFDGRLGTGAHAGARRSAELGPVVCAGERHAEQ